MKNILFDLYGTLIDIHTEENRDTFWNKFARVTRKYKAYEGKRLKQEYIKLCRQFEEEKEEIEILDVFEELFEIEKKEAYLVARKFRRLSLKHITLYKGVVQLLDQLKDKNNKIYLLSNAQASFTIFELKKLGLYHKFDGIAISSNYGLKKPNPMFFKKAIQDFGLEEEIWMIGNDYESDILPAKALGLKTIYVETNLSPKCLFVDKLVGFDAKKILKIIIG